MAGIDRKRPPKKKDQVSSEQTSIRQGCFGSRFLGWLLPGVPPARFGRPLARPSSRLQAMKELLFAVIARPAATAIQIDEIGASAFGECAPLM